MIKVYLDWNVMSGMKNNHFQKLNDVILNKDKFLLLYSTSHIGDIFPAHDRILSGVYPERRGFVKQNIHIKKEDLFYQQ